MSNIEEHQMHEMGVTQLSRGEFLAAVDSFNSILEKAPHDFFALRGLLLASAHLADMDDLVHEGKKKGFVYNEDLINKVIESASEDDRKYFKEFGRIFSDKKRLYDLNHEINSLREDNKKIQAQITLHNEEREYYYVMDRHGKKNDPQVTFFPLAICGGIMLLLGIWWFIMQSNLEANWLLQALGWFCIITGIIMIGCSFIFIFPKVLEIKEIDKYCKDFQTESMKIEEKIRSLETEANKLSDCIRTSCRDFVMNDKLKTGDNS